MSCARRQGGFTLIELMIVVAVIGVLVAIAIPNYLRFQIRSKAGEGKINVSAIKTSELGYFAEYGTYIACSASPLATPPSGKVSWVDNGGFGRIGWAPEGEVSFVYGVAVGPSGGSHYDHFTAEGMSDLDEDADYHVVGYVRPSVSGSAIAGALAGDPAVDCPATGSWNPQEASRELETVGPCQPGMGTAIF
jgi:type IV pilus assembly protein PilA